MQQQSGMCIVNRNLLEDLEPLVGSQAEVMQRLGISWNSWIKIVAGLPVRTSVGQRLKERTLAQAAALQGLKNKFPCTLAPDGINRAALERAFMSPAANDVAPALQSAGRGLRGVRQARSFQSCDSAVG
jgi:hypothetical protein